METKMGVSWAALIALPVLVLLAVALIAGLVALLANRKTRPWTLGVLGLVAVLPVILGVLLGLLSWRVVAVEDSPAVAVEEVPSHEAQARLRAQAEQARARAIERRWAEAAGLEDAGSQSPQHAPPAQPDAVLELPPAVEPIESEMLVPEIVQNRATEGRVPTRAFVVLSPVIALLGFGLLAALVYLLVNPRTRWAVLGLVGMIAVFGLLLSVAWYLSLVRDFRGTPHLARLERIPPGPIAVGEEANPAGTPSAPRTNAAAMAEFARVFEDQTGTPAVPFDASSPDAASAAPKPPKGLLRMVGTALGRAVAAARKEAVERAVQELKQAAESAAPAAALLPDRPDWVDRKPDRNQKGEFEMPIAVGPYTTRAECRDELAARLQEAVGDYAVAAIGPQARGAVRLPPAYIQDKIVREEWEEWKQYEPPLGEMVKLHVLLVFDRESGARLLEEWNRVLVGRRLRAVAVAGAVLLALLTTAWAYLKIDLATGGRRRGRLRLVVAAVLAAVVGFVMPAVAALLS